MSTIDLCYFSLADDVNIEFFCLVYSALIPSRRCQLNYMRTALIVLFSLIYQEMFDKNSYVTLRI